MTHYVYQLIKNSKIVYIGCSRNVPMRLIAHKYTKPYDSVVKLGPMTKYAAYQLETHLIKQHRPFHNKGLNSKGKKKVEPAEKVILVGFYTKQKYVDLAGGMENARALAKELIEDMRNEL